MPDATGTPSTNFLLPKYNPDIDAPSGLGFNTMVDDLDSKLKTKVPNHLITGLGVNDVPVWNGTTWVRASGTPSSSKFLRGDGQWADVITGATYSKVTSRTVTNTVAATDLLNGEITVGANVLPATGVMRINLWGTMTNATGAPQNSLRFQFLLGGGTIFDTNVSGAAIHASGAGTLPWTLDIDVIAANATNAQQTFARFEQVSALSSQTAWVPATGAGITMAVLNNSGYIFTFGKYNAGSSVNMALAQTLVVNVIQPVASANFTTVLLGATVEIL